MYKQKPINIGPENKPRIVLPMTLRKKCLSLLHDTVTSALLGSQKTLEKVKQRFYWYGCRKDVEYWCKTCDICASRKPPYRKAKAPMKQFNVGYPLERCALYIIGSLPVSNNARYLLLVSCYLTKWLMVISLKSIQLLSKFFLDSDFVIIIYIPQWDSIDRHAPDFGDIAQFIA